MEDKLLTQHSSVRLSSQFLKVRNYTKEKRNLWRTTLECNGAFIYIYIYNIISTIRYNSLGATAMGLFQQLCGYWLHCQYMKGCKLVSLLSAQVRTVCDSVSREGTSNCIYLTKCIILIRAMEQKKNAT